MQKQYNLPIKLQKQNNFFNIKTKTFIPSNCKSKTFFLTAKAKHPPKLQKHLALKAK